MPDAIRKPFLSTDIGGTHARLALVRAGDGGGVEILDHRTYRCADFGSLAAIVSEFLSARGPVDAAAIACTGVPDGDVVRGQNLPWTVSLAEIRALGIARVQALNDFVAVAHATQCMNSNDTILLTPDAKPAQPGPTVVVGPGTGFGAALRVPAGDDWVVLASEAGQVSLAPGNERERAVLAQMQGAAGYVSAEQVVSGPGLLRVYRTLCTLDGSEPRCGAPAEVVAAIADDPRAGEAVAIFCAQLGSLLADITLVTGATRVFVAGGVVTRFRERVAGSDFAARFLDKGVMRRALERVPVRLIEDPHNGVIGAASWYLRQVA